MKYCPNVDFPSLQYRKCKEIEFLSSHFFVSDSIFDQVEWTYPPCDEVFEVWFAKCVVRILMQKLTSYESVCTNYAYSFIYIFVNFNSVTDWRFCGFLHCFKKLINWKIKSKVISMRFIILFILVNSMKNIMHKIVYFIPAV